MNPSLCIAQSLPQRRASASSAAATPAACSVSYAQDLDGRVDVLDSPAGKLDCSYDAAGNLTGLAGSGPGQARSYGYDPLYRLESVEADGKTPLEGYRYDLTGNRLGEYDPGSGLELPYTYQPGSHRLTSRNGDARTVDAAGNTTRIGPRGFVYGPNNRLVEVRDWASQSPLASYVHNGRGERVGKTVGTDSRVFLYDEGGALLGEYTGTGAPRWEIVWLDGRPVGAIRNGAVYAIETDHLTTPRALRDRRGTAHWRWDLLGNAFGAHAAETDPDANGVALDFPLRYPIHPS